jgi:hypothetical protein
MLQPQSLWQRHQFLDTTRVPCTQEHSVMPTRTLSNTVCTPLSKGLQLVECHMLEHLFSTCMYAMFRDELGSFAPALPFEEELLFKGYLRERRCTCNAVPPGLQFAFANNQTLVECQHVQLLAVVVTTYTQHKGIICTQHSKEHASNSSVQSTPWGGS